MTEETRYKRYKIRKISSYINNHIISINLPNYTSLSILLGSLGNSNNPYCASHGIMFIEGFEGQYTLQYTPGKKIEI